MKIKGFLLLFLVSIPLNGELIYFQDLDIYLDPPQDWAFTEDLTPEHWTLTDPEGQVIFQYRSYPKEAPEKTLKLVKSRLSASGEELSFQWNGGPVSLGNWTFKSAVGLESAWVLALETAETSAVFLVYAQESQAQSLSDQVLTILNSMARGEEGRRGPGVVSEFYRLTGEGDGSLSQKVSLPWGSVTWSLPKAGTESQRLTLDRESRLLQTYQNKPSAMEAWKRFYRQVFREFHGDIDPLAKAWIKHFQDTKKNSGALPGEILSWLQTLEYDRKGGISDLTSPWETLVEKKGDCDSRALIYISILEHLGFRSILMVSPTYGHGIAAVDIKGPGARFPWEGRDYLVAELTAQVALGQIAQDMADPKKWIGVELLPRP